MEVSFLYISGFDKKKELKVFIFLENVLSLVSPSYAK